MIRQSVFAVSPSETRPILTGVNWRLENGELICIATDIHRFSEGITLTGSDSDTSIESFIPTEENGNDGRFNPSETSATQS